MNLLLSNENIASGLSVSLSSFRKILHAEVNLKRVCFQEILPVNTNQNYTIGFQKMKYLCFFVEFQTLNFGFV